MTDLILRTEHDRSRLLSFVQSLDLAKPKKVAISDEDRSSEQNAKLHAMLTDISRQVKHAGQDWSVLIWKRLLTAAWLRETGESPLLIPAVDGNGFDIIYERTSKLGVKKCASLIEWIQAFGDEHRVKWTQKDYWNGQYS